MANRMTYSSSSEIPLNRDSFMPSADSEAMATFEPTERLNYALDGYPDIAPTDLSGEIRILRRTEILPQQDYLSIFDLVKAFQSVFKNKYGRSQSQIYGKYLKVLGDCLDNLLAKIKQQDKSKKIYIRFIDHDGIEKLFHHHSEINMSAFLSMVEELWQPLLDRNLPFGLKTDMEDFFRLLVHIKKTWALTSSRGYDDFPVL